MRDIKYENSDRIFNFRVCGILIKENKILLNRLKCNSFWTFIGGKVVFGETTYESIIREYKEEIGINVEIDHLVSIVENFFFYRNKKWHELLYFYLLRDPLNKLQIFSGTKDILDNSLGEFIWLDIKKLDSIRIQPECSHDILLSLHSSNIKHIIHKDDLKS